MTTERDPTTILRRMGPEAEGGGAPSGAAPPGNDWAAQATAKVDEVVSIVRDKTVRPIGRAVKFLIFGLLAMGVALLLAVLFSVGIIRVLDTEIFHKKVWASYLIVGGIFTLGGLFLSRMGRKGD